MKAILTSSLGGQIKVDGKRKQNQSERSIFPDAFCQSEWVSQQNPRLFSVAYIPDRRYCGAYTDLSGQSGSLFRGLEPRDKQSDHHYR